MMKSLKPHWCRASRMMRLSVIALCLPLILGERAAAETAKIDDDGTIHLPAVALPDSSLFHNEEREALKAERQKYKLADSATKCPSAAKVIEVGANRETIVGTLKCMEEEFYLSSEYRHLRELYPVTIVHSNIAGIPVEIFTPRNGIESANQQRVLINVHGGGFIAGARTSSKKESIPISSLGKIRVISIDYREALLRYIGSCSKLIAPKISAFTAVQPVGSSQQRLWPGFSRKNYQHRERPACSAQARAIGRMGTPVFCGERPPPEIYSTRQA
jgi:hypothetical protein